MSSFMIDALWYSILGIAQGIFEWLPISSEGAVALLESIGSKASLNAVDLALFLHLGTLIAVLIYFRKDWKKILLLKDKDLVKFLFTTTVVSLLIGFPLYILVKSVAIGGTLLLLMGGGLFLTSYFHKTNKKLNLSENQLALISGALQGLAVIPGLSRSGSTIFGLSLKKENGLEILRLSYLMSAPVVLASSAYLFLQTPELLFNGWPALLFSFLVGILTLKILLQFARKINFTIFTFFFGTLCILGGILSFLI